MRVFFLFLVLANVVFGAWQYNRAQYALPVTPAQTPARESGAPTLVLLRELGQAGDEARSATTMPAADAETGVGTAPPPVRPAPPRCFRIGPVAQRDALEPFARLLDAPGIRLEVIEEEVKEPGLRFVRLEQTYDLVAARQILARLKAKGVRDVALSKLDEDSYGVSLGVFSMERTAEARIDEIRALGFSPTIELQYKTRPQFLLHIHAVGEAAALIDERLGHQSEQAGFAAVACP